MLTRDTVPPRGHSISGDEVENRISVEAVTGEGAAVQVREQNPTSRPGVPRGHLGGQQVL